MKKLLALVLSLSLMLTFFAAWSGSKAPAFAEDVEEEEWTSQPPSEGDNGQ